MKKTFLLMGLIITLVTLPGAFTLAQDQIEAEPEMKQETISLDSLKNLIGNKEDIETLLDSLFANRYTTLTLNKIWQDVVIPEAHFLKDFHIRFKSFKVDDDANKAGLGFTFAYSADFARRRFRPGGQSGISFSIDASGTIAFEPELKPEDFLDGRVSIHAYQSWGGSIASSNEVRDSLNAIEDRLAMIDDPIKLEGGRDMTSFNRLVKTHLRDQFYTDLSFEGSMESNQDFTARQATMGAVLGLDYKPWQHGALNIFDWPFAAIRWLWGYDKTLSPRGASFPTVVFALQRVTPYDHAPRRALGATEDYSRLRGEVAFRTPVSAATIFEANLRYYKEFDAPAIIEEADLDEFFYFTASLTTDQGIFVSYTSGHLPFDAKSDQIYAVGFQFNFSGNN